MESRAILSVCFLAICYMSSTSEIGANALRVDVHVGTDGAHKSQFDPMTVDLYSSFDAICTVPPPYSGDQLHIVVSDYNTCFGPRLSTEVLKMFGPLANFRC